MKRSKLKLLCAAVALSGIATALAPHAVVAQTSMSPMSMSSPAGSEMIPASAEITLVAKIKSIDLANRQVVVVGKDGVELTLDAGPAVRLGMLKKGDTVTAKYYRSVAFALSEPGAPVPPDVLAQTVARPASAPGGVAVRLTRITGLVVGVDLSSNTVEVVNPSGGAVHTVVVTDPARIALLPQLQVGATVTAVVSETLVVSIQPAPKGLFGLF